MLQMIWAMNSKTKLDGSWILVPELVLFIRVQVESLKLLSKVLHKVPL